MLKIRNFMTGEEIPLVRDAAHDHPAWVHEQCDTRSEAELQDMISQYDMDLMREHAGQPDVCGILLVG